MRPFVDHFAGFDIAVVTRREERGAYVAEIEVSRGGRKLIDAWPQTVQPEWLTPEEAIRDGLERARCLIRRRLTESVDHSWVATRGRAQSWFNGEMQHHAGSTVSRS
ncbi:hypothetical protein CI15_31675 [Paraburkholderia monticola]|uniref:DUF6566 domain-containing protein n=1 Tax=Paraburkholderia monticola TaxID=1399968 RepID=A0A149PAV3_9BURK|nr:DUF6566 family protein [Paraburkholderia monticola]KXU82143.1 hypothetical protein CI15_31675 [Paraburkholderia monticola]